MKFHPEGVAWPKHPACNIPSGFAYPRQNPANEFRTVAPTHGPSAPSPVRMAPNASGYAALVISLKTIDNASQQEGSFIIHHFIEITERLAYSVLIIWVQSMKRQQLVK
jgi:hypothetical protein